MIVPDLRGYGDSSKPADGENHANYSKRAMALDQVEVMKSFGFDKFAVVGHDRGGRVGHRMALDHADKVTRLAVLDIIPTHYLLAIWKERGVNVTGKGLPGGHNLQEDVPAAVLAELRPFLK